MMFRRSIRHVFILLIVCVIAYAVFSSGMFKNHSTKVLPFIMAHKPDNAENVALIQGFADRVSQRTHGAISITLVDPQYTEADYGNPKANNTLGLSDVDTGAAAFSQVSVTNFSTLYRDMYPLDALNAPEIFADHAHVARVLDGAVGDDLRRVIDSVSGGNLHALSFTYSGGYRDIYTTVPVSSLADLKGLKMSGIQYMSKDLMGDLGVDVQNIPRESAAWKEGILGGGIQAEEAELIRIEKYRHTYPDVYKKIKTIVETNHNVFLTLIVMNGKVFSSLTPEQQAIITEESTSLALKERALSIQQADAAHAQFIQDGISIIEPTAAEKAILNADAAAVRAKYAKMFTDWFTRIAAER